MADSFDTQVARISAALDRLAQRRGVPVSQLGPVQWADLEPLLPSLVPVSEPTQPTDPEEAAILRFLRG